MIYTEIERHTSHKFLMIENSVLGIYYQVINLANYSIDLQTESYMDAKNWFWANEIPNL